MSLTRHIFTAVALTAALAVGACSGGDAPGEGQSRYERASDRGMGNPDAAVTMIEYSSVSCPHCAAFHQDVFPTIKGEYIDTGRMRYVLREMITGSPQFAIAGFSLARCVPEDRYFDMIDLLFQQQRAIFQAAQTQGSARGQYLAIARSMGLTEDEFVACLNNEDINRSIVEAHDRAIADGVDGTPRFIFNGRMLEARRAPGETDYTYFLDGEQVVIDGEALPGRVDAETFTRLIDHLIAETGGDAMSDEAEIEE